MPASTCTTEPVVYADSSVLSINADYTSGDFSDVFAVYVDPSATPEETGALTRARRTPAPEQAPPPATPVVTLTPNISTMIVGVTNPAPGAGEPPVNYNDIYVTDPGKVLAVVERFVFPDSK